MYNLLHKDIGFTIEFNAGVWVLSTLLDRITAMNNASPFSSIEYSIFSNQFFASNEL